jgi:hypothetical protein
MNDTGSCEPLFHFDRLIKKKCPYKTGDLLKEIQFIWNFYHMKRKGWTFDTGDCLIEVTAWPGLTVFGFPSTMNDTGSCEPLFHFDRLMWTSISFWQAHVNLYFILSCVLPNPEFFWRNPVFLEKTNQTATSNLVLPFVTNPPPTLKGKYIRLI